MNASTFARPARSVAFAKSSSQRSSAWRHRSGAVEKRGSQARRGIRMPTSRSGGSGQGPVRRPRASRRACPSRPRTHSRRDARCVQAHDRHPTPRRSGTPSWPARGARADAPSQSLKRWRCGELDLRPKLQAPVRADALSRLASSKDLPRTARSRPRPFSATPSSQRSSMRSARSAGSSRDARPRRLTVADVSALFQAPMPAEASRSPAQDASRPRSGSLGWSSRR